MDGPRWRRLVRGTADWTFYVSSRGPHRPLSARARALPQPDGSRAAPPGHEKRDGCQRRMKIPTQE